MPHPPQRVPTTPSTVAGTTGYPAAGAVTVLALCAVDLWAIDAPFDLRFLLLLPALALPLGALSGGLLGDLLVLSPRLRFIGPALLPLAGLAAGGAVAVALGVLTRLQGPQAAVAFRTLAACAGGGLGLALLLWLMQARGDRRPGRLPGARPAVRALFALLLLSATAALTWADHTFYVRLYPAGHLALRLGAFMAGTFGLRLLLPRVRLGLPGFALLAGGLAAAFSTFHSGHTTTVQAFITRPWPSFTLRLARGMWDVDRDGFSPRLAGGDCDDLNPHIHPEATEVPGNGVDDNCMFGDAQIIRTTPDEVPRAGVPSTHSVVLVTIDTLRWDRLGLNDPQHEETMPELSRWARKGTNFRNAYTPGGWTSIALAALLHGKYARRLSWEPWYESGDFKLSRKPVPRGGKRGKVRKMFPIAFNDPGKPLPFWLQRRGMYTAAVVDDGFSQMLGRPVGTGSGFDSFREVSPGFRANNKQGDAATTAMALRLLRQASARTEPFFLWVHYFGPHTPNTRHDDIPIAGDSQEASYDHEVRYLDRELSRFLAAIERVPGRVATFVTSDHGEVFGKGYRSHGMDLRQELIHVPLVAHVPDWPHGERRELVSLIDLMPTVLSLTDTPAPPGLDGQDLGPVVRGKARLQPRVLLCDSWLYRPTGARFSDMVAAFDGDHKVVFDRKAHGYTFQDQRRRDGRRLPIERGVAGPLIRAALGYVEETGGTLRIAQPKSHR